jgi:hypothetical protein
MYRCYRKCTDVIANVQMLSQMYRCYRKCTDVYVLSAVIRVRFQCHEFLKRFFFKNPQISHIFKIRLVGVSRYIRRDGQTHDEANSRFSQFCESAQKYLAMCLLH